MTSRNGTDDLRPLRSLEPTRGGCRRCSRRRGSGSTPSSRPPANAIGIDRSPPSTTAASEPSTTSVNTKSCSWNSGAMSTPPRPARIMVMIHAAAEVRAAFTPRMLGQRLAVDDRAHLEADTGAADHEPQHDRGERGDDEHRDLVGVQHDAADLVVVVRGRADTRHRQPLVDRLVALEAEVEHVVADGQRPATGPARGARRGGRWCPTMRAYTGAFASRRSRIRSSSSPSSGAKMNARDDQRGNDGHAEPGVQLVVEVGGRERHRAVGEVEDARRRVREHEPRRHDPVDRTGDQAGEDEVPELALMRRRPGRSCRRRRSPVSPEVGVADGLVALHLRRATRPRARCRG